MNILLDECLDWRLEQDLPGHNVKTVQNMGWNGIKNGDLLRLAEKQFDTFLTADRNLAFQQHPQKFAISRVVLKAQSIRLVHIRPLMGRVLHLLPSLKPGQLVTVS